MLRKLLLMHLLSISLFFISCANSSTEIQSGCDANEFQNIFHKVIQKVTPSIVALSTKTKFDDVGFGSGVIIDKSGYVLTSEHVITNAEKINVLLSNQRIFSAEVVSSDLITDLAVLKVKDAEDFVPIDFGDNNKLQVGDIVFAIGNAFGHSSHDGQPSVTQGIISALNRVATSLTSGRRYWNAIQHDASVNPGNSGGPLIDMNGKMIGLNGVINSKSGNNAGVSFAVPVNIIKKFLPKLKAGEKIKHPFIGISDLNNVLTQINSDEIRGVQIGLVSPDSPAAKGGLKNSDIIINADDKVINNSVDFFNWLYNKDAGDDVKFEIIRIDEKKSELDIRTIQFKLGTIEVN